MSAEEMDAFLSAERTCRVGTVTRDGPHVTPLWFVWDGAALWLHSLVNSQRWTDLERDPRVSVSVDAGEAYGELRGVELRGEVAPVGDVPRTDESPELADAERRFARKYFDSDTFVSDGRHGWLRMVPNAIASWDFRKMASLG